MYYIISVVTFLCFAKYSLAQNTSKIRTPDSIHQILEARCLEYQQVVRPDLFQNASINCSDLWTLFNKAFAYKDKCSVKPEDYEEFIEAADHYVDTKDKVMYWSGNIYPFIINFVDLSNMYTTIRNQLAVYSIEKIEHWCGQTAPPGINYLQCPQWGNCSGLATTAFWTKLSKHFAKKVQGTVHVMLNGSSKAAYSRTSIFAHSELTNLDKMRTPVLHVHLVHNLDSKPTELCNRGSLLLLKEDVEKKGMKFKCSENEPSIIFFQCIGQQDAGICQRFASLASTGRTTNIHQFLAMFCLALLFSYFTNF